MESARTSQRGQQSSRPARPFRTAIFRGLGVLAPPLLTIVIFVWVGSTVYEYVLKPVTGVVREAIVAQVADIRHYSTADRSQPTVTTEEGLVYQRIEGDTFIPFAVYEKVQKATLGKALPSSAKDFYRQYVDLQYLRPYVVIPVFLLLFVLVLYLLGKFLAAGIGRALWRALEQLITRVPLVRSVYSAVKQFSDFFFNEKEVQFTRVVAIEYPRRGIWSMGFVVSESFLDISAAANEPVVAVYVPTSPMPMAGFTTTLPKRDVIDLNITIDQALQFIVSCGVVAPPYEAQREMQRLRSESAAEPAASGS
jgi:uncharacterized membrane protein